MTVGIPTVFEDGPIAITGDNLNTMVQIATVASQLRTVTALDGMAAMLLGIATPGDGLGGFFRFVSTATASDDNLDVLVPNGSVPGAWLRLTMQVVQ
jgi:hypothetical protein